MKNQRKLDPAPAVVPGGEPPANLADVDKNPLLADIAKASAGDTAPSSLPNIDEVLDKHLGTGGAPPAPKGTGEPPAGGAKPSAAGDYIKGTFDHLKKVFGEGYEVPKDVTEDTFLDKVYEAFQPVFEKNINPQALHLHNFLSGGGKLEDYIKGFGQKQDYTKMKSEDALMEYFKLTVGKTEERPEGMEEQAIKDYISKMDQVAKLEKATQAKVELKKMDDLVEQKTLVDLQTKRRDEAAKRIPVLKKSAEDTIAAIGTSEDIFGIPVTKEDLDSFNKEFPSLIIPDESGTAPVEKIISNMISDNKNLYKLLFIASRAGEIQDLITSASNRNTRDLKTKLSGKVPGYQSKAGKNSQELDFDALARPAQD